ncbi:MAG: nitrogen regulation protein NR(I) [Gammaproteobacteria bacterium]|jgi:two-component system nitrogen regulation response regulator GlnG|nr:nitrogen regulation protein NR(I) [Gammaproteobacteria bacterium]
MNNHVWVIDDDRSIRWVLDRALSQAGIPIKAFDSADQAMHHLDDDEPVAVITDVRMPGMSGLELLEALGNRSPSVPVVIMTAHSDLQSAVDSFERGAFEYLPKPFDIDEAVAVVQRAIAHSKEKRILEVPDNEPEPEIIGKAPAMQEVFRAIGRLSSSDVSVLINGPSGSGKELVAKALHKHSPRANKPFIALNVAAIPDDLIESELFGHEKGAFTGATQLRQGRFEQANEGTLFLDEIGDMPATAQTRLLRVLAENEFYRVGGHQSVKVNVRIVAATHQNLEARVEQGRFREDLFHRLNVIRVHVPALAGRRTDIPALARHFLDAAAKELGDEAKRLTPEAESYISLLPWPGNVRQLENTCRWLHVMASSRTILIEDLPPELQTSASPVGHADWESSLEIWAQQFLESQNETPLLDAATPRFERVMINAALRKSGGRKKDAADLLGWGRNTLTRKLQELN